jgi:large subunit ribosomal protein L18
MANGPRYRVPFRRRREGKTNYIRRLKLIRSRRNRLVIRCTLKNTIVQVVDAKITGDIVLSAVHSRQLAKNFGWNYFLGNLPSAYLTGYLCGLEAKKAGVEDAILDVGIIIHSDQVKAAFKGYLDAGMEVPHEDSWFSEGLAERITGEHIRAYAELLSNEDPEKYKKQFSKTLKNKADPLKIVDEFNKVKATMEKKI